MKRPVRLPHSYLMPTRRYLMIPTCLEHHPRRSSRMTRMDFLRRTGGGKVKAVAEAAHIVMKRVGVALEERAKLEVELGRGRATHGVSRPMRP